MTIRPIQAAHQRDYDRQMRRLDEDIARRKYSDLMIKHRLTARSKRQSQPLTPVSAVCAVFAAQPNACPMETQNRTCANVQHKNSTEAQRSGLGRKRIRSGIDKTCRLRQVLADCQRTS